MMRLWLLSGKTESSICTQQAVLLAADTSRQMQARLQKVQLCCLQCQALHQFSISSCPRHMCVIHYAGNCSWFARPNLFVPLNWMDKFGLGTVSSYRLWANITGSSAMAEGPRDVSCQLKSCQLPRHSAETTCTTSPEQTEVMKLEGYSLLRV